MSYSAKHLLWLQESLSELFGPRRQPYLTKHAAITYHYTRGLVLEQSAQTYVPTRDNVADKSTKRIVWLQYEKLCQMILKHSQASDYTHVDLDMIEL